MLLMTCQFIFSLSFWVLKNMLNQLTWTRMTLASVMINSVSQTIHWLNSIRQILFILLKYVKIKSIIFLHLNFGISTLIWRFTLLYPNFVWDCAAHSLASNKAFLLYITLTTVAILLCAFKNIKHQGSIIYSSKFHSKVLPSTFFKQEQMSQMI